MIATADLYLAGASFVAALASGLAGFAFALIASGVYLHVLEPTAAVALVLAGSLATQSMTIFRLREGIVWRRFWPFLIGGIVGAPLGVALLGRLDDGTVRLTVGGFLVAYSLLMLAMRHPPQITGGGQAADGAVGLIGGIMGGFAGLSGALPTVWCNLRGWPKDEQRGVYQPFIVAMQGLALATLAASGGVGMDTWIAFAICLPALLLGAYAGLKLYARVDDKGFRRIVLSLLLLSGLALLV
jgi:uncharacterized protein